MTNKFETVEISPYLKAVEGSDPFGDDRSWWSLYVLGPKGWVRVQAGTKDSSLWWDMGITLPH